MPSTLIDEYRKVRTGQIRAASETGQRSWFPGAAMLALRIAREEIALQAAEANGLIRFRWECDTDYEPEHAGDETDGDRWLAEEIRKLETGEWEALGCVAEVPRKCQHCGEIIEGDWEVADSLWGIVIDWADTYDYKREVERQLACEAGVIS